MGSDTWNGAMSDIISVHYDMLEHEMKAVGRNNKQYFATNLESIRVSLEELRDQSQTSIDDKKYKLVIDAISKLEKKLDKDEWDPASAGGLDSLIYSVDDDSKNNYPTAAAYYDLLENDHVWSKIGKAVDNIDSKITEGVRGATATNEGDVLYGLDGKSAGHGHDDRSERVASTTANAHINPDGLIETINALPDEHRADYKRLLKNLVRLTADDPSDKYLHSDMEYVYDRIK
jgi:hypothetical protein